MGNIPFNNFCIAKFRTNSKRNPVLLTSKVCEIRKNGKHEFGILKSERMRVLEDSLDFSQPKAKREAPKK